MKGGGKKAKMGRAWNEFVCEVKKVSVSILKSEISNFGWVDNRFAELSFFAWWHQKNEGKKTTF